MTYQMNDTKWNSIKWFFDRLWENPDNAPDAGVLLVMNDQETRRILTQNRLRLLSSILKKDKPMPLSAIINEMQLSEKIVLKELQILEKIALVERDEKGSWRARQPIILPEIEFKIKRIPEATAIL